MPNIGPLELVVLFLFLAVLLGGLYVVVRVIRRAWGSGEAARIRQLEARVEELEKPNPPR